jgi:hypothetical protein
LQRAYGLEVPQNLKEACDPRRLALIVYDMQVGILRQVQGGDAVTANVAKVPRHMSLPRELMGVFQFRMAMAWQRVGSVDDVHPEAGERALASLRYMGDALFTDVAEIRDVLSTAGGPPPAAPWR